MPHSDNPTLAYTEIIQEEANLVRLIFHSYAGGQGYKTIANHLNHKGYATKRGKVFSSATIRGILTNRNYIGQVSYSTYEGKSNHQTKRFVQGIHEPIIDLKLWNQVQEQLSKHSLPVTKLHSRSFPLSGLLKCPSCGKGMIPSHVRRTRKSGKIKVSYYYICSNYASHGLTSCRPFHVPAEEAEHRIERRLAMFLNSPAIAERLLVEVNQRCERDTAPFQEQLKRVTATEFSLRSRGLRCYELFEDGHIDGTALKQKLEEIRGEAEKLQLERGKLEQTISSFSVETFSPEQVRRAFKGIASILNNTVPEKKRDLYRSLIQSITVPPDRNMEHAVIHGNVGLLHLNIPPILNERGEPTTWKK